MALNFPSDTSQPYIDTTSGLKYVYNDAVGAWESAIQPPVIINTEQPNIDLDGFLWYDSNNASVLIRLGTGWVPLTGQGSGDSTDPDAKFVTINNVPPYPAGQGQLWWDNTTGRLMIYYIDNSGDHQWTEAAPNVDASNGSGAFPNPTAPTNPTNGELWFNTVTNELYVFYANDGEWLAVEAEINGVLSLDVNSPLFLAPNSTDSDPVIGIQPATSGQSGHVRFANGEEADNPTDDDVVLSPKALRTVLSKDPDHYIRSAGTGNEGIVQLATPAQVQAGTSSTLATTPEGVAAAIAQAGSTIAPGTITLFACLDANGNPAPGYLICNGQAVSRAAYPDLFDLFNRDGGLLYGDGDGSTTFNLPDLSGSDDVIAKLPYGIYCIKT